MGSGQPRLQHHQRCPGRLYQAPVQRARWEAGLLCPLLILGVKPAGKYPKSNEFDRIVHIIISEVMSLTRKFRTRLICRLN